MATPSDRGASSVPQKTYCLRVIVARGVSPGSLRSDWPMGLPERWPGPAGSTPESMVDPARRRPRLIRRMLTSTQLDILMRRCREEGVTIHGALAAAMAMVIGPAAAQRTSGRMCIGSPIDFRAELVPPVSADEAGSYVSSVPSIVRFGGDRDLWAIARKINRSLGRRRRFGQHLSMLWALRFICPASVAKSSQDISTHGAQRPSQRRYLDDRSIRIPSANRRLAAVRRSVRFRRTALSGYLAATVNTSHGELFWNFTYTDGAVSHRSAQRFADGCLHDAAPRDRLRKEGESMEILARWLSRYAGWILAVVVVLLVLCGLYSANLSGRLSGGGWTVPGSEEARAERAQDAGFVGRGSSSVTLAVHDDRFSAPSTEFDQRVAGVTQRIAADPRLQVRGQLGWTSLPSPQRDELLGRDARTTLTTLELGIDDGTAKRVLPEVERELSALQRGRVACLPGGPGGRIRRHQRGRRRVSHACRIDFASAGGGDPVDPVPQCRRGADLPCRRRDRDRCRDGGTHVACRCRRTERHRAEHRHNAGTRCQRGLFPDHDPPLHR